MAYFNECEYCGAALDPNEKCDCLQSKKNNMRERYIHAGKTVKVKQGVGLNNNGEDMSGADFFIEDWCINLWFGTSWLDIGPNGAAIEYAKRILKYGKNNNVPFESDDVLGGKIDGISHLFHINELELEGLGELNE